MLYLTGAVGLNPDWGRLIYNLRAKHDVSQRMLAKLAGVDRSTLWRLERGTSECSPKKIERMLGALGYAVVPCVVQKDAVTQIPPQRTFRHSTVARRQPYQVL